MNSSDILSQATRTLPKATSKLIILDPKVLRPVIGLHPRKGILDALTTAHKTDWKIVMISDQSLIARCERTLYEVLDSHQATMARYGGLITESLFTPNNGGEMVITRYGIPDIGQFHTQSALSQKIAKTFDCPVTEDWFKLPSPGLLMAAVRLQKASFPTTLLVGDENSSFGALDNKTGVSLVDPAVFEQKGVSDAA